MAHYLETNDPDRVLSYGEHAGFRYVIAHNPWGFRLGYVCIPKDHPWYGKHYNDIETEVHGGLTYSEPGSEDEWWIGFDCAHAGDKSDMFLTDKMFDKVTESMKFLGQIMCSLGHQEQEITTEYVEKQCFLLCEQAATAVSTPAK